MASGGGVPSARSAQSPQASGKDKTTPAACRPPTEWMRHGQLSGLHLALSLLLAVAGAGGPARPLSPVGARPRLVAAAPDRDDGHPVRRLSAHFPDQHGEVRPVPDGRPGVLELLPNLHPDGLPMLLPGGAVHPPVSLTFSDLPV